MQVPNEVTKKGRGSTENDRGGIVILYVHIYPHTYILG
jgi:hypothetical protein